VPIRAPTTSCVLLPQNSSYTSAIRQSSHHMKKIKYGSNNVITFGTFAFLNYFTAIPYIHHHTLG
jgi:hypothetical protein